jgi:hypothetical protein
MREVAKRSSFPTPKTTEKGPTPTVTHTLNKVKERSQSLFRHVLLEPFFCHLYFRQQARRVFLASFAKFGSELRPPVSSRMADESKCSEHCRCESQAKTMVFLLRTWLRTIRSRWEWDRSVIAATKCRTPRWTLQGNK